MGLLNRKSRWERLIEPVAAGLSDATRRSNVRKGLAATGAAIGVSVASAVVSSVRRQQDKK
jgi:cytolysin (calcineurin-like family phosphatase)